MSQRRDTKNTCSHKDTHINTQKSLKKRRTGNHNTYIKDLEGKKRSDTIKNKNTYINKCLDTTLRQRTFQNAMEFLLCWTSSLYPQLESLREKLLLCNWLSIGDKFWVEM